MGAPSSSDNRPERDAGVNRAHQIPWLTWGTEGTIWDNSNWSKMEGGEEELECPPPLESHLQELWVGRRHSMPVQEWRIASHELWCPRTPNPPPWKMQSGYCGALDRWTCQTGGGSCERSLAKMTIGNLHGKCEHHLNNKDKKSWNGGRLLPLHTTSPSSLEKYKFMPPLEPQFSSWDYWLVQLTEDPNLCKGPSALGRKGPTASSQQAPSFGR